MERNPKENESDPIMIPYDVSHLRQKMYQPVIQVINEGHRPVLLGCSPSPSRALAQAELEKAVTRYGGHIKMARIDEVYYPLKDGEYYVSS